MAIEKARETLIITSDAFVEGGKMPIRYTGEGEDVSPNLILSELAVGAESIVVMMDDMDHPMRNYSHWVLWNMPVMQEIPEAIPYGQVLMEYGGAVQGVAYGKHRYRGPKPPLKVMKHKYHFKVYVLNTKLNLPVTAKKRDVLQAMQGHVLQYGSIIGVFH